MTTPAVETPRPPVEESTGFLDGRFWLVVAAITAAQFASAPVVAGLLQSSSTARNAARTDSLLNVLWLAQAGLWFVLVNLSSHSASLRRLYLLGGAGALTLLHAVADFLTTTPRGPGTETAWLLLLIVACVVPICWPITAYLRACGWRLTDAPLPAPPAVRYSLREALLAICGGSVCFAAARWFYTHEVEVYAFLQPLGRALAGDWLIAPVAFLYMFCASLAGVAVMLPRYPRLSHALLALTVVFALGVWMSVQSRTFTGGGELDFAYFGGYACSVTVASLWLLRLAGWRFERTEPSPPPTPSELESSAALGDARRSGDRSGV